MARRYARGFVSRYKRLTSRGLLEFEAEEIAGAYPTFRRYPDKSDPSVYIRRMMRSRWQTIINLTRYGYSKEMIEDFIVAQYTKRGWLRPDGELDVWKMLEHYRQISIALHEYFPTRRKHGIRGGSVGKGDVKAQKARASYKKRRISGKYTAADFDRIRGR